TAALPQSLSPLEARVTLTVDDAAGRAASRSTIVPVRRDVSWIGIGRVATRETSKGTFAVDVDAMAVDAAGSPRGEIDIAYKLYREQPEFVWFREEGEWNYRAEVSHLPVAGYQGSVRSTAAANTPCDAANVALPPVELSAGDYVMELSGRDGMRARRRFSIGAASAGLDRPEPSILTIRANRTRTTYKAGETAEFIIESPFPARILSAVVSAGRVLGWYEGETVLDTDKRHAERLSIPLARSWQGQLHVVSTAFRTGTDGTVARGPARAIGVMPLAVDIDEHVRIASLQGTPHRVTPASGIPLIRLEAKDKAGAPVDGEAMIALFAVDEGLLTLTQHAPPSPIEHFYGTRRLDFDVHDSYTRLLLAADPGGDGGLLLQRLIFNNYLSQRIVAAKLLKRVTFNKGVALIEKPGFDLSGYAGTVKLAAVAWSESWIAIAEHGTLVRDAIVADLGLPRFLSPGDKPQIPLMLENVEALDDDYAIELSRDVRRALLPGKDEWIDLNDQGNTISLRLERGKRQIVHLELGIDADDLREGDLKIGVELKSRSPDNPARLAWNWRSRIRLPFTNAVRRVASLEVAPGATGVLNLPPQALASMKRPRLQVRLSTRAIPLPARGSPRDLARSPDTLERLVWSGMQLVGDEAGEHRGAMQRVIEAILALQQPSGAFADFKPQTTSEPGEFRTSEADSIALDANERLWHMAGAVELLREAKASGFATDRALGRAADSLKSQVAAMLKPRDDYFRPTPEVMIPERSVTLDGSASGSLSASFEDILVEDAQALGIAPGTGSRVLEVAEGGAAAKAGLVPGDVVLEIDGFRAGTPSEVGRVIRKRPAGSRAVLALLRDGKRQSVVVTLDAVAPPMRSEAADAPAEIDGDAQRLTCTRGLAYAIATLVRLDRVALAEMEQLAALCGPKETEAGDMPSDGIAPLIAASALVEFGKAERAAPLLAGFRAARAPQDGEERAPELQAPDPALDAALTLVFLRRAEPAAPELSVIAARFPERLSPPSQAWLARLARESADGSQLKVELTPARVGTEDLVEVRDGGTATTRFVEPQVLSQGGVRVRNTGDVPVVATVFAHGLDSQATPAEGGGRVQFVRRFAKLDGAGLGDGDIEVKQNEVFVVLVEGTAMAGPDGNVSDRIVLIDLLPSGLEIVRAVTPGAPLAGAEGGEDGADDTLMTNREPLKPFGHVIYNEMRDDKYVAVLQPHHKGGQFRAVYLVRATVPGEYRVPQSRVEDWRQPEVGVFRDEARTLRITRATAP
ncbi:MAG: PDZ domain-containing protein, partial [Hyphomicrobiaceae bacterium]